jgi:hypothetical protein
MEIFAIYLLICDTVATMCACAVDEEKQELRLDYFNVRDCGIDDMRRLSITAEEAEDFGVAR